MPRVRFLDDTLHVMARWAAHRYRLNVQVMFCDGIEGKNRDGESGCAYFVRRGQAVIELNTHRTHSALVQVLAHELTHVIAMRRFGYEGHGPIFRRNLSRLVADWNAYARGGARQWIGAS